MDEQIIKGFSSGDPKAFRLVYDRYWPMVYRIAMQYMRSSQEAEEAVQDIFLRLWKYRESIQSGDHLKGYLVKISYSVLVRLWHNRKAVISVALMEANQLAQEDADQLVYQEFFNLASDAIQQLPEKRRQIFLMSREDQMTYDEIAQTLGISKKTVENQMTAALKFLKEKLISYPYPSAFILAAIFLSLK